MRWKSTLLIVSALWWIDGCADDGPKNLSRAMELFTEKKYEEALDLYLDRISTEGASAQIGAGWCHLFLKNYAAADSFFETAAGDSLLDGYAGWSAVSWTLDSLPRAITAAEFVLRKNSFYTSSFDSSITAQELYWIQASAYFELGQYSASVQKIRKITGQANFNPDLNSPDIAQVLAAKLESLSSRVSRL